MSKGTHKELLKLNLADVKPNTGSNSGQSKKSSAIEYMSTQKSTGGAQNMKEEQSVKSPNDQNSITVID